jgi:hypothetical protein
MKDAARKFFVMRSPKNDQSVVDDFLLFSSAVSAPASAGTSRFSVFGNIRMVCQTDHLRGRTKTSSEFSLRSANNSASPAALARPALQVQIRTLICPRYGFARRARSPEFQLEANKKGTSEHAER